MVCTIGRPGRAAEREILSGSGGVDALADIVAVTTPAELTDTMAAVRKVHCAHNVLDYVLDVADATRVHPGVALGVSPRASLSLLYAAQAHATVTGRDFVSPDDVKAVAAASLAHRLVLGNGVDIAAGARVVADIVGQVAAPRP
jgi:MoxR-like ATPase